MPSGREVADQLRFAVFDDQVGGGIQGVVGVGGHVEFRLANCRRQAVSDGPRIGAEFDDQHVDAVAFAEAELQSGDWYLPPVAADRNGIHAEVGFFLDVYWAERCADAGLQRLIGSMGIRQRAPDVLEHVAVAAHVIDTREEGVEVLGTGIRRVGRGGERRAENDQTCQHADGGDPTGSA